MNITIIGAGNVGATLGKRWAEEGHDIIFGVRDPNSDKIASLLSSIDGPAKADTIRSAVAASDIIVLATPWSATKEVIEAAGSLEGKIIIDCTNPLKADLSGLEVGFNTSAAEEIAQWVDGAKVVKAFNTAGSTTMANPVFGTDKSVMFICGDDAEAKKVVFDLADQLGFDVVDSGDLKCARYLEPLAMLWIHLAFEQGMGTDFAMKIVKR